MKADAPAYLGRSRSYWRELLRRHGIRPDKRLGQHFLVEPKHLRKVLAAAELSGGESVLEIGAGIGTLTVGLAEQARRVIAVEYDARLLPALREAMEPGAMVEIIHGDILDLDLEELVDEQDYWVIANIPYHITSMLLRRLLEAPKSASRVVLTVQREVAERVVASPGQMSLLALSVQAYGVPALKGRIPPQAFYPEPRVESSVLRIDIHPDPLVPARLVAPFFRLARAGFAQRRKKLRNALAGGLDQDPARVVAWLHDARIDPSRRAQELSLQEWIRLAKTIG